MRKLLLALLFIGLLAPPVLSHVVDAPLIEGLPVDEVKVEAVEVDLDGEYFRIEKEYLAIDINNIRSITFQFGRTYVFGPGGGWQTKGQISYQVVNEDDGDAECVETSKEYTSKGYRLPNDKSGYTDEVAVEFFDNGVKVNARFHNGNFGHCPQIYNYTAQTSMPEKEYLKAVQDFRDWIHFQDFDEGPLEHFRGKTAIVYTRR